MRTKQISIIQNLRCVSYDLVEHACVQITSKHLEHNHKLLDLCVLILVSPFCNPRYLPYQSQNPEPKQISEFTIKPTMHVILNEEGTFRGLFQNLRNHVFKGLNFFVEILQILRESERLVYECK